MAITYNDLILQSKGNLGYGTSGIVPEIFVGFFLASKSFALTAANMAADSTLMGVLQTATCATITSRMFPLLGADAIVDLTDNTPEATMEESGYGNLMGTTYKKHNFTVRIGNLGQVLNQNLYKYVGNKDVAICFVDAKGRLFMKQNGTGAKFMPCQIVAEQTKMATGSTSIVQNVKIMLDETDAFMGQNLMVYPFGQTLLGANQLSDLLHGIHDVEFTSGPGTQSTTHMFVTATVKENLSNFGTTYAAQIAAADATAFTVVDKADGTTVPTISAVAVTAGVIDFTGTFTTGHTYNVSLAPAATLIALGSPIGAVTTGGFESNVVEIVIP